MNEEQKILQSLKEFIGVIREFREKYDNDDEEENEELSDIIPMRKENILKSYKNNLQTALSIASCLKSNNYVDAGIHVGKLIEILNINYQQIEEM